MIMAELTPWMALALVCLTALAALTGYAWNNRVEVRRLVAEVCKAMRADCFEKSNLSIEEIRALVPIA